MAFSIAATYEYGFLSPLVQKCKKPAAAAAGFCLGVPTGIRTPVIAVKGRCPRPLDDGDILWKTVWRRFSVSEWWR